MNRRRALVNAAILGTFALVCVGGQGGARQKTGFARVAGRGEPPLPMETVS